MANRVRTIRKEICLTEQEDKIIKSKMADLGAQLRDVRPQDDDRRLHY